MELINVLKLAFCKIWWVNHFYSFTRTYKNISLHNGLSEKKLFQDILVALDYFSHNEINMHCG